MAIWLGPPRARSRRDVHEIHSSNDGAGLNLARVDSKLLTSWDVDLARHMDEQNAAIIDSPGPIFYASVTFKYESGPGRSNRYCVPKPLAKTTDKKTVVRWSDEQMESHKHLLSVFDLLNFSPLFHNGDFSKPASATEFRTDASRMPLFIS